jgi:hypothetical protein
MTSVDGVNFGSQLTLPETSYWFIWNIITGEVRRTGPALAAYNGKLYLAWAGTDKRLDFIPSVDGTEFPSERKTTLEEGTERSPVSAEYSGNLYLAWRGNDTHLNDTHLNVLRLTELNQ